MSLAQGNPFVLSYRLHIIGPAQECNHRVTCRVCFTISFLTVFSRANSWPDSPPLKSGRLTTSLAGRVAQLTVTSSSPVHLFNLVNSSLTVNFPCWQGLYETSCSLP